MVCQVGLADVTQCRTWVSSPAEVRKDRACLELTLSSDSGSVGVNFQSFTSNFQKPLFQVTESKNTPWTEKSQKPLSLGAGPGVGDTDFAQAAPSPLGRYFCVRHDKHKWMPSSDNFVLLGLLPSSVRDAAIVLGFCELPRPQEGKAVGQGSNFWLFTLMAV